MKASEYKVFKGIRKESLKGNMTDMEIALADLEEMVTRELANDINQLVWKKIKKSQD